MTCKGLARSMGHLVVVNFELATESHSAPEREELTVWAGSKSI